MGNEDIISLVFQMLAVNVTMDLDTKKKTRKMLYNMALLGRAFTGPALNSLWRVLPSMLPLFRLLPAFGLFGNTFVSDSGRKLLKFYSLRIIDRRRHSRRWLAHPWYIRTSGTRPVFGFERSCHLPLCLHDVISCSIFAHPSGSEGAPSLG